jgi:hypothetical protein
MTADRLTRRAALIGAAAILAPGHQLCKTELADQELDGIVAFLVRKQRIAAPVQ